MKGLKSSRLSSSASIKSAYDSGISSGQKLNWNKGVASGSGFNTKRLN